jgi:hypothetical protein
VEIVDGDVAGDGYNDMPNLLLALLAPGFPARSSAEAPVYCAGFRHSCGDQDM